VKENSFVTMRSKDSSGEDIQAIIWATLNPREWRGNEIMPFYERLFDANLRGQMPK
jgi:hypothetical protein